MLANTSSGSAATEISAWGGGAGTLTDQGEVVRACEDGEVQLPVRARVFGVDIVIIENG